MENSPGNVDVTLDACQHAFDEMPRDLAYWLEYEAAISYNPVNIVEHRHNTLTPWVIIFEELRAHSQLVHRQSYNGVHPSLDAPGPVW